MHPLLRESEKSGDEEERAASGGGTTTTTAAASPSSPRLAALSFADVEPWLPRFDALVVGPGLGSDPAVEEAALLLLRRARALGLAVLIDADGLKLVSRDPASVRGYGNAVLTPNAVEFERIAGSLGLAEKEKEKEKEGRDKLLRFDAAAFAGPPSPSSSSPPSSEEAAPLDSVAALALELDGPVVVRKGAGDCMAVAVRSPPSFPSSSPGTGGGGDAPPPPSSAVVFSACCSRQGSPRRAGGQGDLTSGSVAAFLAWACSRRLASLGEGEGGGGVGQEEKAESFRPPAALAAAFGGCSLVRGAAAAAFSRRRRAALASDVLDAIEGAEEPARRGFDV